MVIGGSSMKPVGCVQPDGGIKIRQRDQADSGIDPRKITASTIIGDKIKDKNGNQIGKIEEVVLDLTSGTISYVVLSVGGLAGIGDKLFAIPLQALSFDNVEKAFYLNAEKKSFKNLPGFDKLNWPEKAQWPIDKGL